MEYHSRLQWARANPAELGDDFSSLLPQPVQKQKATKRATTPSQQSGRSLPSFVFRTGLRLGSVLSMGQLKVFIHSSKVISNVICKCVKPGIRFKPLGWLGKRKGCKTFYSHTAKSVLTNFVAIKTSAQKSEETSGVRDVQVKLIVIRILQLQDSDSFRIAEFALFLFILCEF